MFMWTKGYWRIIRQQPNISVGSLSNLVTAFRLKPPQRRQTATALTRTPVYSVTVRELQIVLWQVSCLSKGPQH